jgi:hypothetical protein
MMIRHTCPHCEETIHSDENLAGLTRHCPHCRLDVRVPEQVPSAPEPAARGGVPSTPGPALPSDDRLTAKWRPRLREFYQKADEFPVLAVGEERASALWLILTPVGWWLMNKIYLVGYRSADHALYLFRVQRGIVHSFAGFTEMEIIPLHDGAELEFKSHLLPVTSLRFRDKAGRQRTLTFALPSRENSKALYQAIVNQAALPAGKSG